MMIIHAVLNLVSSLILAIAAVRLLHPRVRHRFSMSILLPLLLSVLFYLFITISNILEHLEITAYFDPMEDVAELLFLLFFLFFVNNWRTQRSLELIRNKERWLNSAFEFLGDGVMTTDPEGKILYMNRRMEEFTGRTRQEALGKPVEEVLRFAEKDTEAPLDYSPFRQVLAGEVTGEHPRGLYILGHPDRKTLVTETVTPILDEKNLFLGAVGSFHDIGEFSQLMEQLTHVHRMEAVGQLAGGIAHDMNNMLGGIMGAADLLRELPPGGANGEYGEILDIIIDSTENARDLTANLLAFSRKGKVLSTPISVGELLGKTVAIAERTIDRALSLEVQYPREDFRIVGDPAQFQNALLNLILNARDAQPSGGRIEISVDRQFMDTEYCKTCEFKLSPGNYVRIRVTDRGAGVPPELKTRIFEPFFTTKEEGKGTGLGLAAVYGTMINHHGAVMLENLPGGGASFSLYFPESGSPVSTASPAPAVRPVPGKKRILVIEDESFLRSTMRMMLENIGYECFTAESGPAGLALFQEHLQEIDLVLLDMVMPEMPGPEVLSRLKALAPSVPVVITSGFHQEGRLPPDAAGFLKKPFRMRELLDMIESCLPV